ncbi:MAG: hypothetical protein ACOCX2_14890, partial [Armatimonadota bacterium]
PEVDSDQVIENVIEQLAKDLGENLGLRNLRIDVDGARAIVASQMPDLDGHGHLQPIIAYMLVNAALAAPWTDSVSALFEGESGTQFGISAPAEAARNLARGEIDVQTFLQLCRFADPDPDVVTSGGIVGNTGVPGADGGARTEQTLLPRSGLPAGWLASGARTIDVADLDQIIPGLQLSAHSISWGAIQVVQADDELVTVVGLQMPEVNEALQLAQLLATVTGGNWADDLLKLPTDPPLHAVQAGERTYLLQGDAKAVAKVAQTLTTPTTAAGPTAVGGLNALLPGGGTPEPSTTPATPAAPPRTGGQPAETEPATPPETPDPSSEPATAASQPPEPVKLSKSSYLKKAYLCTAVSGGSPVELDGPLPAGAERLGVYIEVKDAPHGAVLEMELFDEGFSLGRRMTGATGDRRTVIYFAPTGGFGPGTHWLEITADDELLARTFFEVQ